MSPISFMRAVFTVAALSGLATATIAQQYPSKPIRIIIPWGPGQTPDVVMRALGQGMSRNLGQPVVIENKPGGTGAVGADYVAASQADGYTLLDVATAYVIARGLRGQSFDATKDMAPVAMVTNSLLLLSVNAATMKNVRTLDEFIAFTKANPKLVVNYGSSGIGSATHLAMALLAKKFNINANHIPYKGGGPLVTDYLSGQLTAMISDLTPVAAFIKSGQITPIMVLLPQRSDLLPDLPTARELGYPDVEVVVSHGLTAPFGTPAPVVEKLAASVKQALAEPDVVNPMVVSGNRIVYMGPVQYASSLNETFTKWKKFTQDNDIKGE